MKLNTNSNSSLLDQDVKINFGGNLRTQRRDMVSQFAEDGRLNEEEETANNIPSSEVTAPAKTTKEKLYFGMKPKKALLVGTLLLVAGVLTYLYIKNKNKAALIATAA